MCKSLPNEEYRQKGQVVLIVLLVLSVVSIMGLSVVSRSITDIKVSQQSQEAARALWVAQGGLEKAMKANIAIGQQEDIGGVKVWVSKTSFGGENEFVFPNSIPANDPATLWLVGHDEQTGEITLDSVYQGNRLTFFWGDERTIDGSTPALEATLVYEDSGNNLRFKRYTFDPNQARVEQTHFTDVFDNSSCSCGGKNFAFCSDEITLPDQATPYLVRLRLLFNNTVSKSIGVKGNQPLPTQGSCFESSAKIEESGITRKLRQCQQFGVLPKIFDFLLFSGGNI